MLRLSLTNGNANVTIGMSQSRCCDAIKTEKSRSNERRATAACSQNVYKYTPCFLLKKCPL